jgi:hypothetical protein
MTSPTNPNSSPELTEVERVARAICAASGNDPDRLTYHTVEPGVQEPYGPAWCHYEPEARAAIQALSSKNELPSASSSAPSVMTQESSGGISGSSSLRSPEPVPVSAHSGDDPGRAMAEYVAARLGNAQRRVILSLTGDWGEAACHQTARRMFYGVTDRRYTVVHHKHRTDNCWCLSALGEHVKELLLATQSTGETK